jgi:chromosome segregation ATPase
MNSNGAADHETQQELKQLKQTHDFMKRDLDKLKKENESLQDTIRSATELSAQLAQENLKLNKQVQQLQSELADAHTRYANATASTNDDGGDQSSAKRRKLNPDDDQRITEVEKQFEQAKRQWAEERHHLQQRIDLLSSRPSSSMASSASVPYSNVPQSSNPFGAAPAPPQHQQYGSPSQADSAQLAELRQTIENLHRDNQHLKKTVMDRDTSHNAELARERATAKQDIQEKSAALHAATDERNRLSAELTRAKDDLKRAFELRKQLEETMVKCEQIRTETFSYRDLEITNLRNEYDKLEARLKDIQENKSSSSATSAQLAEMSHSLDAYRADSKSWKSKHEAVNAKLTESEAKLKQLQREKIEQDKRVQELEAKLAYVERKAGKAPSGTVSSLSSSQQIPSARPTSPPLVKPEPMHDYVQARPPAPTAAVAAPSYTVSAPTAAASSSSADWADDLF